MTPKGIEMHRVRSYVLQECRLGRTVTVVSVKAALDVPRERVSYVLRRLCKEGDIIKIGEQPSVAAWLFVYGREHAPLLGEVRVKPAPAVAVALPPAPTPGSHWASRRIDWSGIGPADRAKKDEGQRGNAVGPL